MNRLFVAYKPSGIGSNRFLGQLKRRYGVKKAGYSGTLDPFAKGVLIVAFGKYTSLFRFLDKTPKTYRATLWLGAHSPTLDIEGVGRIDTPGPLNAAHIDEVLSSLKGELAYRPPIFSAKRIEGRRAYDLAREGHDVVLETVRSTIYDIRLLHYRHPFVTFEATVSEGTYIRSLGAVICERLGIAGGALSMLERLREGRFVYENERPLDIREVLAVSKNRYLGDPENLWLGRKLRREDFEYTDDGFWQVEAHGTLAIFRFDAAGVHYELNRIAL